MSLDVPAGLGCLTSDVTTFVKQTPEGSFSSASGNLPENPMIANFDWPSFPVFEVSPPFREADLLKDSSTDTFASPTLRRAEANV